MKVNNIALGNIPKCIARLKALGLLVHFSFRIYSCRTKLRISVQLWMLYLILHMIKLYSLVSHLKIKIKFLHNTFSKFVPDGTSTQYQLSLTVHCGFYKSTRKVKTTISISLFSICNKMENVFYFSGLSPVWNSGWLK